LRTKKKSFGLVVNDFYIQRATAVAEEVEKLGVTALPVQGDVSNFATAHGILEQAEKKFGRIDILELISKRQI
jgi:2-hydroxycyclohexanecarboxyl-CoA dehydrogenase